MRLCLTSPVTENAALNPIAHTMPSQKFSGQSLNETSGTSIKTASEKRDARSNALFASPRNARNDCFYSVVKI